MNCVKLLQIKSISLHNVIKLQSQCHFRSEQLKIAFFQFHCRFHIHIHSRKYIRIHNFRHMAPWSQDGCIRICSLSHYWYGNVSMSNLHTCAGLWFYRFFHCDKSISPSWARKTIKPVGTVNSICIPSNIESNPIATKQRAPNERQSVCNRVLRRGIHKPEEINELQKKKFERNEWEHLINRKWNKKKNKKIKSSYIANWASQYNDFIYTSN